MNEEMQSFARRAVACKHWRWMPGMLAFADLAKQGGRVCRVDHQIELALDERKIDEDGGEWHTQMRSSTNALTVDGRDRWNHLPDLTDPATLGCLLALVREAWNDPGIACVTSSYSNGQYYRRVVDGHHHGSTFQTMSQATYLTEAEALVAALEAAP